MNAVPKKYDESFKRQALEMVLQGGKTVKQVAEHLGVSQYSIYRQKEIRPIIVSEKSGQAHRSQDMLSWTA